MVCHGPKFKPWFFLSSNLWVLSDSSHQVAILHHLLCMGVCGGVRRGLFWLLSLVLLKEPSICDLLLWFVTLDTDIPLC